jgi:hypothetical protein
LLPSGAEPNGPLNSSLHTSAIDCAAAGCCALNSVAIDRQIAAITNPNARTDLLNILNIRVPFAKNASFYSPNPIVCKFGILPNYVKWVKKAL